MRLRLKRFLPLLGVLLSFDMTPDYASACSSRSAVPPTEPSGVGGFTMETNPIGGDDGGLIPKIMGGPNLLPNELPFMVHLTIVGQPDYVCGGAIISPLYILTAAHCLIYIKDTPHILKVTAGDHNRTRTEGHEQVRDVSAIILHEDYNHRGGLLNDIALLKLSSPLTINAKVKPIDYQNVPTEYSGRATVAGWGKITNPSKVASSVPRKADINLQSCSGHFPPQTVISDSMMCAGEPGLEACEGDSGGPLSGTLVRGRGSVTIVVGIASKAKPCNPADHNTPGVYTNVSKFGKWIDKKISSTTYSSTRCASGDQYYCRGMDKCIRRSFVCDGDNDCGDREDESRCYSNCTSTRKFRCDSSKKCIPSSWVCDGANGCGDRQDERPCDTSRCPTDQPFLCRISGICISKSLVCDGRRDCSFSEDEESCY